MPYQFLNVKQCYGHILLPHAFVLTEPRFLSSLARLQAISCSCASSDATQYLIGSRSEQSGNEHKMWQRRARSEAGTAGGQGASSWRAASAMKGEVVRGREGACHQMSTGKGEQTELGQGGWKRGSREEAGGAQ